MVGLAIVRLMMNPKVPSSRWFTNKTTLCLKFGSVRDGDATKINPKKLFVMRLLQYLCYLLALTGVCLGEQIHKISGGGETTNFPNQDQLSHPAIISSKSTLSTEPEEGGRQLTGKVSTNITWRGENSYGDSYNSFRKKHIIEIYWDI